MIRPTKRDLAFLVSGVLLCLGMLFITSVFVSRLLYREQVAQFEAERQRQQTPLDAAEWTLTTMQGDRMPFTNFGKRVVLVNVWATWCKPCIEEIPTIERLAQAYQGDDRFRIVMVSSEEPQRVKAYLAKRPSRLPYYVAEEGMLRDLADSSVLPRAVLLDCHGAVVRERIGATDWDSPTMRADIDTQLRSCAG